MGKFDLAKKYNLKEGQFIETNGDESSTCDYFDAMIAKITEDRIVLLCDRGNPDVYLKYRYDLHNYCDIFKRVWIIDRTNKVCSIEIYDDEFKFLNKLYMERSK